jgi:hypothetical protein
MTDECQTTFDFSDPKDARRRAYQEKQEAKRERLEARAAKARAESQAGFSAAKSIADGIPMGQPILVGHHSEKRHRRDIKRIDSGMRKGIENQDKAARLESRAASVGEGGISSDDPDAADKLRERLVELEAQREMAKKVNRSFRTGKACPGVSAALLKTAQETMKQCPWLSSPMDTKNTSANIRRVKARIAELEKEEAREEAEPVEGEGFRIEEDAFDNRVRFFFDERPSKEVCRKMRRAGFRWSPTAGAWQRHLNNAGRYAAKRMASELFGEGE